MPSASRPTLAEVVRRAEALVPRLRERANRAEHLRRLPDETLHDFLEAGLFRVLQPARFGGYELDYGRTQVELCHVLGQGCGSSAWIQCVVACHAWCLAMFPPAAQDAVWQPDPDTLIATAFSFKTGHARPAPGGYQVQGDWQFSSGSDLCQWIILGTPIIDADALAPPRIIWSLLPRRDFEILDTWYAAGLRGSASNDIRVKGAFVPAEFTLDINLCDGRPTPGSAVNASPMYHLPLRALFPYNISTPALGIARGALDAFVADAASRPQRASMAQLQLRLAESACEIDAALALLRADSALIAHAIQTGQPLDRDFTARSARDTSYAVTLCVQAVDRLAQEFGPMAELRSAEPKKWLAPNVAQHAHASRMHESAVASGAVGAHGMAEDSPIQRAQRDVHAVANHAGNSFDNHAVFFARHALQLPPP